MAQALSETRPIHALATRLMRDRVSLPETKLGNISIRHRRYDKGAKLMLVPQRVAIFSAVPYCEYTCKEPTVIHELYSEENGVWMSDLPVELVQMRNELARYARGRVLIGGLGLGIVVRMCALMSKVTEILVVEKDKNVIDLIWPHIAPHLLGKARVVHADLNTLIVSPKSYNVALMDTWQGTGEMVWTGKVVPLRRRFAQSIRRIISWQEEVMFGQMVRPLYRATTLNPDLFKGIPHYYAFAKVIEEKGIDRQTVPDGCDDKERWFLSEAALRVNQDNPFIQMHLSMFLHHVGTRQWEEAFGRYWDESIKSGY